MPTLDPAPVTTPGVLGLEDGEAGGELLGVGVGEETVPATAALWALNKACSHAGAQRAVCDRLTWVSSHIHSPFRQARHRFAAASAALQEFGRAGA